MFLRREHIRRWVRPEDLEQYLAAGWLPADQPAAKTEVINLRPAKQVIEADLTNDDNAIIKENTNGNIDGQ